MNIYATTKPNLSEVLLPNQDVPPTPAVSPRGMKMTLKGVLTTGVKILVQDILPDADKLRQVFSAVDEAMLSAGIGSSLDDYMYCYFMAIRRYELMGDIAAVNVGTTDVYRATSATEPGKGLTLGCDVYLQARWCAENYCFELKITCDQLGVQTSFIAKHTSLVTLAIAELLGQRRYVSDPVACLRMKDLIQTTLRL